MIGGGRHAAREFINQIPGDDPRSAFTVVLSTYSTGFARMNYRNEKAKGFSAWLKKHQKRAKGKK